MERSFEAWEEVQRYGLDLADRLVQGFSGLLSTSQPFLWPTSSKSPFDLDFSFSPPPPRRKEFFPAAPLLEIGGRLGQAGAEIGACVGGVAQQLLGQISQPPLFRREVFLSPQLLQKQPTAVDVAEGGWSASAPEVVVADRQAVEAAAAQIVGTEVMVDDEDEGFSSEAGNYGPFRKIGGTVNVTATYDSRNRETEASLVARGDLWRVEASTGGSTSGNETSPLFLVQLGPFLFVRDSTFLIPVHLSKQHLLWYGYDRKNGMHSLCPALWSKHRRWMMTSMMCLNPFTCSFLDLQFPCGQLTYIAGEGLAASSFVPLFGGLLQAHGKFPGDSKVIFSCKNKRGTLFTPTIHWPERSFSLGIAQALAWKRSGLLVRPTIQLSVCPTLGGNDPGVRAEVIHSLKEELSIMCGFSCSRHPSAFTSLSIGRSKSNGNVGSSGLVICVDLPLSNTGRPTLSIQLNGGIEF